MNLKPIVFSELEPGDTAVIKEIYDSENAQEIFEIELERALQVNHKPVKYLAQSDVNITLDGSTYPGWQIDCSAIVWEYRRATKSSKDSVHNLVPQLPGNLVCAFKDRVQDQNTGDVRQVNGSLRFSRRRR